jgi:AcrR family transcriptional regulator
MAKAMKKSERTREAILASARHLFAREGFERTTVREVAERARIDPAMVIRYFGSKDGLFAEAAAIELELPAPQGLAPDAVGQALIEHFLELWEGRGRRSGMAVLLRSAASNKVAAGKMKAAFSAQVTPFLEALGAREGAARRAALISSQLLGLAMCRYVLELPAATALTHAEIVSAIGPTLQRYASSG